MTELEQWQEETAKLAADAMALKAEKETAEQQLKNALANSEVMYRAEKERADQLQAEVASFRAQCDHLNNKLDETHTHRCRKCEQTVTAETANRQATEAEREPLVGPISMHLLEYAALDWIIVGGESGPKARPCDVEWIRSIVRWGRQLTTPVFVKQLGENRDDTGRHVYEAEGWLSQVHDKKGGDPAEWPADLRVRQFPEARRG